MADRIWILGAPDPEMERIKQLLHECGESVIYATTADGRRVTAAEAYRCPIPDVPPGATVYAVECIDVLPDGWVRVDHHRPGDPGYGRPPAEFLAASSIGQVIAELARLHWARVRTQVGATTSFVPQSEAIVRLGWEKVDGGAHHDDYEDHYTAGEWSGDVAARLLDGPPVQIFPDGRWHVLISSSGHELGGCVTWLVIPSTLVLAAAADHCLGAAYRGECPGVDPDALMRWRIEQRAAHQGRSVEEVLADVERAREALRAAPTVQLADGIDARDMRVVQHGVPELPEAAAREGVCFVARLPGQDGRTKIVCQAGSPEQIRAFMTAWAPAHGLVDIYGDPARGFAGGYLAT